MAQREEAGSGSLIDLSTIPDEELRGRAFGRLVLLLLKHFREGNLWERLPRWGAVMQEVLSSTKGLRAMSLVMSYIVETMATPPPPVVQRFIREELGEPTMRIVTTWADKLREEGMEKGLEKGLEKGREEGLEKGREEGTLLERRSFFLQMAELRFGPLPAAFLRLVEAANADQLKSWSPRLLTATSLDDLIRLH